MKKINKDMLKRAEELSEKDTEGYIIVSDAGISLQGSGATMLAYLTVIMKNLFEEGMSEKDVKKCMKLAQMSDEEISEQATECIESLKSLKEILNELKEALEDVE